MSAYGFRPSRKFLYKKLLQVILTGMLALGLSFLIASWSGDWISGAEGASHGRWIALAINLVWFVPALFLMYPYYRSYFYEIHEDEVVMHTGILTRRVTHVPLQRITNLEVLRGPFDRVLGLGTIHIQTAGSTEHTRGTECLVGLQNFKEVFDQLTSGITRTQKAEVANINTSPDIKNEMLDSLMEEMKKIRSLLEVHEH